MLDYVSIAEFIRGKDIMNIQTL